jgi:hypothetical protein
LDELAWVDVADGLNDSPLEVDWLEEVMPVDDLTVLTEPSKAGP